MNPSARLLRRMSLMLIGLALAIPVVANLSAEETVAEADAAVISKLIEQLGSDAFDEREAAAVTLRKIGTPAAESLRAAKDHKSAEVRSRAAMLLRQMQTMPLRDAIRAYAAQSDEKLDLEEGMWLISRIVNNEAAHEKLKRQLDRLADAVRKKLGNGVAPKSVAPDRIVAALREVLFEEEKFGGNFNDYENPANSSLEKVLQSKKGLPILVSHVVIAVGRRLEIPIVGVPTSGRYIIKYDGRRAPQGFPTADIFIDPFNDGKILSRDDREELFPGNDPDRLVEPQSHRKDLIRMLSNIETHLFNRDETDRAYVALEFRLTLQEALKQGE